MSDAEFNDSIARLRAALFPCRPCLNGDHVYPEEHHPSCTMYVPLPSHTLRMQDGTVYVDVAAWIKSLTK